MDDIISLIDNVSMHLNNGFYDQSLQGNIITMCNHLKLYSHQLEIIYKGMFFLVHIIFELSFQIQANNVFTKINWIEPLLLLEMEVRMND